MMRVALGVVCGLVFAVSVVAILLLSPPALLLRIGLALAAGASLGGFVGLIWPKPGLGASFVAGAGCAALIGTLLAIPAIQDSAEPPSASKSSTATATATATAYPAPSSPSPTPPPSGDVLFDDFNGKVIDRDKWTLTGLKGTNPESVKQIYVKDGKLHLGVSPKNSKDGVSATMTPLFSSDGYITKITMKMAISRLKGPSTGAAYLVVLDSHRRRHRLWMGPDKDGSPSVGYYMCNEGQCLERDTKNLTQDPLEPKREFTVEAISDEYDNLSFSVTGHEGAWARFSGPVASFKFEVKSDPGRDFEVTVDDIRITYAE